MLGREGIGMVGINFHMTFATNQIDPSKSLPLFYRKTNLRVVIPIDRLHAALKLIDAQINMHMTGPGSRRRGALLKLEPSSRDTVNALRPNSRSHIRDAILGQLIPTSC
jgi:hypothetical protein